MGDFQEDTRVEGGQGCYRAELTGGWEMFGAVGGYVATVALRAAGLESEIRRPVGISCSFLRNTRLQPVALEVTRLRRSARLEVLRVSMHQGERHVVEALVRNAAETEGLEHDVAKAPEVPGPETLTPRSPPPTSTSPRGSTAPRWTASGCSRTSLARSPSRG